MTNRARPAHGAKGLANQGASPVRYSPMHEQILPVLRRDIVENRWKSGERLSEPLLCEEFGVSRTPLRQALKALEAEGFVRLIPHVGAVVTDPNAAEVEEKIEILIALEQLATTRVTEAAKPEVLTELHRIHSEITETIDATDGARYHVLRDAFHSAIVRGYGNRSLIDLHEQIMWHLCRERHRGKPGSPVMSDDADSYGQLLRVIRSGKSEAAGRAMRRRLENAFAFFSSSRQSGRQQKREPDWASGSPSGRS
jgi:DNA-binding GntR family transcriptional regulator